MKTRWKKTILILKTEQLLSINSNQPTTRQWRGTSCTSKQFDDENEDDDDKFYYRVKSSSKTLKPQQYTRFIMAPKTPSQGWTGFVF